MKSQKIIKELRLLKAYNWFYNKRRSKTLKNVKELFKRKLKILRKKLKY